MNYTSPSCPFFRNNQSVLLESLEHENEKFSSSDCFSQMEDMVSFILDKLVALVAILILNRLIDLNILFRCEVLVRYNLITGVLLTG